MLLAGHWKSAREVRSVLTRLYQDSLNLGNLTALGAGRNTPGLTGGHVLDVEGGGIGTLDETRHGDTPFGMSALGLASPLRFYALSADCVQVCVHYGVR
jgi:hypothetical protein